MLINADLGECLTPNPDTVVMPLIDMANIACGGHAGDDKSMLATIKLALKNKVKIGAHPSYADTANFGRISHLLSDIALFELIYQQITDLQTLCTENGARLTYIKPHGALYHQLLQKSNVLAVLCQVIEAIDANLLLVVPAGNQQYFTNNNITFLHEVFADRGYQNTIIIPRGQKNAVLNDANAIIKQYQTFLTSPPFKIDTICFHGDNPASVEALRRL